jgi:hypothetical protein
LFYFEKLLLLPFLEAGSDLGGNKRGVTELLYLTDVIVWELDAALFLISSRSVGKRENTSTVVGHCILKY